MDKLIAVLLLGALFGTYPNQTEIQTVHLSATEISADMTETEDLVFSVYEALLEKAEYGDNMEALNEKERIFYITQQVEAEVNNGGFSQFFFNSSGNFSGEMVSAFEEIGAVQTAQICQRALDAYPVSLPAEWGERQVLLDEIETDEIYEKLNACDSSFYEYPENLYLLNYEFIINNKEFFEVE